MTDFAALRQSLADSRARVEEAVAVVTEERLSLARADVTLQEARLTGNETTISRALRAKTVADRRHADAIGELAGRQDEVSGRLHAGIGGMEASHVLDGVDRALPITLLPVRLETRFAGPPESPVLKVRIYPDDLHVDDHEPGLSEREVELGRAYWTSVRGGTPEEQAWSSLVAGTGPYRALWVREILTPTGDAGALAFPDVAIRAPGTSRPALARALPDVFLVRVRAGGQTTTVSGTPVDDTLQVGADLSDTTRRPTDDGGTLVMDERMRWMSDFDHAMSAGMGVEVPLPPSTEVVEDVVAIGVCVSLDPNASATLLSELVARHHVTHGAGFVAPGTPTNNLADTSSGWSSRPDPARVDPATRPAPSATSNAGVLAAALGLPLDSLAALPGAADADGAESEVMSRALFEASWGPYLRQQAQPGFRLSLLPAFFRHVTGLVKGGGPLPAVRLGRQPYGVLPIQPGSGWEPFAGAEEDTFVRWLADYLPRIRELWLSGVADAPSGLAVYAHEAVSTRVRIRTANASSTRPWLTSFGFGDDDASKATQDRRLLAELQLGDVLPGVISQLFTKGPANLWLPMSTDEDLDFLLGAPSPKDANSILGLLLRNAALQVRTNLADEYIRRSETLVVAAEQETVGYASALTPMATVPSAAAIGVSADVQLSVTQLATYEVKLASSGVDAAGERFVVGERVDALLADSAQIADIDRYWHRDALLSYRSAHKDLAAIPPERRGRLAGEVIDCASHRYDAWVTSLATKRLGQLRSARPTGAQIGAWGAVQGIRRRPTLPVAERPDGLPLAEGTVRDPANLGFVLAPSLRHANVAGVLRAAWIAHGGPPGGDEAPFAVSLTSARVRAALAVAQGMREGQPLGALLGYRIERFLHDASGHGVEVDWAVFVLREQFATTTTTGENVGLSAQRLVTDGWRVAQQEMDHPGSVVEALLVQAPGPAADLPGMRTALRAAVADLVASLDGLTDLGLAEAVHQLSGANFDRAAAATDMIGRATLPPEVFEVAATPRGGRGIEQRLAITFQGTSRPPGFGGSTPRARLAPLADAFVARRIGDVAGVVVRLVDEHGAQLAATTVGDLGVSALDLAADAVAPGGTVPMLTDRARRVTGAGGATSVARDVATDAQLLEVLEHAACWHHALAGRKPLSLSTFEVRTGGTPAGPDAAVLAGVLALAAELESVADPAQLSLWGLRADAPAAETGRRAATARAESDPVAAARALFGSDAVVVGEASLPPAVATALTDQGSLGIAAGDVEGWLQDTGRVRDAARALDEALLLGQLVGRSDVATVAGQVPPLPYAAAVIGDDARRWVGLPFPGALGAAQVLNVVVVGDGDGAAGPAVGVELDSWVEVVPEAAGSAAVAANLSAPDSRAPNTILLAVPADAARPWTQEALFSVVDEALELATARLVDLDASKRVPALLPAVYLSEVAEPRTWGQVVALQKVFPVRYVATREGDSP